MEIQIVLEHSVPMASISAPPRCVGSRHAAFSIAYLYQRTGSLFVAPSRFLRSVPQTTQHTGRDAKSGKAVLGGCGPWFLRVRVSSSVLYFVTSLLLCVFFTRGSASSAPSSCCSILFDSPADSSYLYRSSPRRLTFHPPPYSPSRLSRALSSFHLLCHPCWNSRRDRSSCFRSRVLRMCLR
jgi:hypothetical protein